jgi:hypothetical protein
MDLVRPDVFIPSEDEMSDIIHNAPNTYTLYLDSDGKEDVMSIESTVHSLNLLTQDKSSKVLSLTITSPYPPESTASTSTTPFVSMTFNPSASLFSIASGSKSRAFGPLTPKSHAPGNIHPVPLRSRFFHAEDAVTSVLFKPLDDDKENYIPVTDDNIFEKTFGGLHDKIGYGRALGGKHESGTNVFDVFEDDKRCLRCHDKAGFHLEPWDHSYIPTSTDIDSLENA